MQEQAWEKTRACSFESTLHSTQFDLFPHSLFPFVLLVPSY